MTDIVQLNNKGGNVFYPQTHTSAVIDSNGYTAESRMQALQNEINQAQMAIGAVPSDITPTENSTNWVTSDGLYKQLNKGTIEQVKMSEVFLGKYYLNNGTVTAHSYQYTYYIPVLKDEKYLISLVFPTARALRSAFFENVPSVGATGTDFMISETDATEFERQLIAPYDGYLAFSFYKSNNSNIISLNVYHFVSHIINIPSDYYNSRDNINKITSVYDKIDVNAIDSMMINDSGVITSNAFQILYYAKVKAGDVLHIKTLPSESTEVAFRYGETSIIPISGGTVLNYIKEDDALIHELTHVVSSNGYFVCSIYQGCCVIIRKKGDVSSYGKLLDKSHYPKTQRKENIELASSEIAELPLNYVRKNTILKATINYGNGFSQTRIGRGNGNVYQSFYVELNSDNLVVHQYVTSDVIVGTYIHGLTLGEEVTIMVDVSITTATIRLISDGNVFTVNNVDWLGGGAPYVKNTGSNTITLVDLTFVMNDIVKNVWLFGDSYLSYWQEARWTYWMLQWNFDNWLCDSLPGSNSKGMYQCFINDICLFTPRYAVWLLGMNDGTNSGHIEITQNFICDFANVCTEYGITPILATIPSVPNKNRTEVNAFIRNSGYRYIDLAASVNTNESTGTWKAGMLSSDNIHPTELGAKQLAARVLLDFPEIMIK